MIQNYANVSNLLMEVAKGTQTISKHMRNVARRVSRIDKAELNFLFQFKFMKITIFYGFMGIVSN